MTEPTPKNRTKAQVLVSAGEESRIARTVLAWLNASGALPVQAIRYEMLETGVPNMAMSLTSGTYKTRQFVTGGYQAQMKFALLYRIQPGDSSDQRLKADEALNALGDWVCAPENLPGLGERCKVRSVVIERRALAVAAFDSGDEDHELALALNYEVL